MRKCNFTELEEMSMLSSANQTSKRTCKNAVSFSGNCKCPKRVFHRSSFFGQISKTEKYRAFWQL